MPGKQVKILSDANIEQLLAYASRARHPTRNRLIVLLSAYAAALRGSAAHSLIPLSRSWRTRQPLPARQRRSVHRTILCPNFDSASAIARGSRVSRHRRPGKDACGGERDRLTVDDETRLFDCGLRVHVENADEPSIFGMKFRNGPHQIGPMLFEVERIRGASGKTTHPVM